MLRSKEALGCGIGAGSCGIWKEAKSMLCPSLSPKSLLCTEPGTVEDPIATLQPQQTCQVHSLSLPLLSHTLRMPPTRVLVSALEAG